MGSVDRAFDLSGRVAIITGGAGLLGLEYADVLAEAGADIVVADFRREACQEAAEEICRRHGVRALPVPVDVTDEQQVEAMTARVMETFGKIDILVNNAALTAKGGSTGLSGYLSPFEEYPLDAWERSLKVNLTSMFLCSRAAGREMARRNRGVLVNISSIYGVVGPDPRLYEGTTNPYAASGKLSAPVSYAAAKGAVLSLTRYLATYWADRNIRVNALTPGGVYEQHDDTFVKNYAYRTPLGRMADKGDYRGAMLFLVSDASSYMTGANLVVDGGWTAW
ncbi:MAG: SDR family oxidoreductase [Chloroflexi bacterium]|nr:SDR family oxidoreductase [Chloroflexota bacterium]